MNTTQDTINTRASPPPPPQHQTEPNQNKKKQCGKGRVVRVTGVQSKGRTATVLLRGSNRMVLDEADRSLHDALCCIRCLAHKRFLIAGGAAPEVEVTTQLARWAKTLQGMEAYCVRAFAEALEVVPYTLAENAGLNPIAIVTELRQLHAEGHKYHGINVKKARRALALGVLGLRGGVVAVLWLGRDAGRGTCGGVLCCGRCVEPMWGRCARATLIVYNTPTRSQQHPTQQQTQQQQHHHIASHHPNENRARSPTCARSASCSRCS